MTTPHDPDDGNIADTGMFRRFVEHEEEMDRAEPPTSSARALTMALAVAAILVVAIAVWLIVR